MYYQRSIVYIERQPELAYARFHEGLPHIRSLGDRYILGTVYTFFNPTASPATFLLWRTPAAVTAAPAD
jgi:hypothetical protein